MKFHETGKQKEERVRRKEVQEGKGGDDRGLWVRGESKNNIITSGY